MSQCYSNNLGSDVLATLKSCNTKDYEWISMGSVISNWSEHQTYPKAVAGILIMAYTRVDTSKTHALSDLQRQRDKMYFAHMFTQKSVRKWVLSKFPPAMANEFNSVKIRNFKNQVLVKKQHHLPA